MNDIFLTSVTDKRGLVGFAAKLEGLYQILSTGGTRAALVRGGIEHVGEVSDYTGVPEMFGGRLKTLHHKIFAGILAKIGDDMCLLEEQVWEPVALVAVNLYDFEGTAAKPGVTLDEMIEQIDIGGPSLLRAAAKNWRRVTVICDPDDYDSVAEEILANGGAPSKETRYRLARKALSHTAAYDAAIVRHLPQEFPE